MDICADKYNYTLRERGLKARYGARLRRARRAFWFIDPDSA